MKEEIRKLINDVYKMGVYAMYFLLFYGLEMAMILEQHIINNRRI